MTFKRYVCWKPDRVHVVMNTDAERIQDDVFAAVHTRHNLTMVDPDPNVRKGWGERRRWEVTPENFLAEFLSPTHPQVKVGVLGESGSGKSHFIHWLALNIPRRDDLYVFSIGRSGTSLRGILERIIAILPEDEAHKYSERLNHAGYESGTHAQRKERLLSMLALAIGADAPRSVDTDQQGLESHYIRGLPNVFNDPTFRRELQRDGRIVDALVAHIEQAPKEYRPLEERQAFREDDLPLTALDISELSRPAKQILAPLIGSQEDVPLVLEIINRNLGAAISQVLNFTGDQLLGLMLDIRRFLRREGKGLVLLIEDLSRLGGVESTLLEALIEPPTTGPEGLCEIRWAMAVTRGYYDQLPNTIHTRMDYLIDMDLATHGDGAVFRKGDRVSFAARYLNAARADTGVLETWYKSGPLSGLDAVPNACGTCPHMDICHATFGSADGMGLYPFTAAAILNMAERTDPQMDERFNPRRLIKSVLVQVLDLHRTDLEEGRFPSEELLRTLGGRRLALDFEDGLKRADPENFPRQRAVLELWGALGHPPELPEALYDAFDLPKPRVEGLTEAPLGGNGVVVGPEPPRQATTPLDRRLQAVRNWGRGGVLTEDAAQGLYDPVYKAVESFIDWDTIGLQQTAFAGRSASSPLFRTRSVRFHRQATQIAMSGVMLVIPLSPEDEDELRHSALALEGLLQFGQHGHWNFAGGHACLVALGECLPRWADWVVHQFRRLPDSDGLWDPVASAVEVLAVGLALGGGRAVTLGRLPDVLNSLFEEPWPEQPAAQSREWRQLYAKVYAKRAKLREIVQGWASGTKGGEARAFLAPARIVPPLRRIRRKWATTAIPPSGTDQGRDSGGSLAYAELARLHFEVRSELGAVARSEYDRKLSWLAMVRKHMSAETTRLQVVEALELARSAIGSAGIPCTPSVLREFNDALESFRSVYLDDAIKTVEELAEAEDPVHVLPRLGRSDRAAAIVAAERFFPAAANLLAESEAGLRARRSATIARVGDDLVRDQERVRVGLDALGPILSSLSGARTDAG
jgi:hypothetical protein